MNTDDTAVSCALHQIYDLASTNGKRDLAKAIWDVYTDVMGVDAWVNIVKRKGNLAFVFSDKAIAKSSGSKLAKLIKDEELGELICTKGFGNLNYQSSEVKVWVFVPNKEKMAKLFEQYKFSGEYEKENSILKQWGIR